MMKVIYSAILKLENLSYIIIYHLGDRLQDENSKDPVCDIHDDIISFIWNSKWKATKRKT